MGFDEWMAFRDCPWCGLTHGQFNLRSKNLVVSAPTNNLHPMRCYSLLTCPACGGAVVLETDTAGGANVYGQLLAVSPEGDVFNAIEGLPDEVAIHYRDAVKVLRAGVPDAAAVQLRKTLEAAAAQYGITEKPLVRSIERLIEEGHVTKTFGDVLQHVRKVGNAGAHYNSERVDADSAAQALRFTTALLRNLFEVPHELAQLGSPTASVQLPDAAPVSTA